MRMVKAYCPMKRIHSQDVLKDHKKLIEVGLEKKKKKELVGMKPLQGRAWMIMIDKVA